MHEDVHVVPDCVGRLKHPCQGVAATSLCSDGRG